MSAILPRPQLVNDALIGWWAILFSHALQKSDWLQIGKYTRLTQPIKLGWSFEISLLFAQVISEKKIENDF